MVMFHGGDNILNSAFAILSKVTNITIFATTHFVYTKQVVEADEDFRAKILSKANAISFQINSALGSSSAASDSKTRPFTLEIPINDAANRIILCKSHTHDFIWKACNATVSTKGCYTKDGNPPPGMRSLHLHVSARRQEDLEKARKVIESIMQGKNPIPPVHSLVETAALASTTVPESSIVGDAIQPYAGMVRSGTTIRIDVGIDINQTFGFPLVEKLTGPQRSYLNHIERTCTGASVSLRGDGSGEGGKEPLHFLITCSYHNFLTSAAGLTQNLVQTVRSAFENHLKVNRPEALKSHSQHRTSSSELLPPSHYHVNDFPVGYPDGSYSQPPSPAVPPGLDPGSPADHMNHNETNSRVQKDHTILPADETSDGNVTTAEAATTGATDTGVPCQSSTTNSASTNPSISTPLEANPNSSYAHTPLSMNAPPGLDTPSAASPAPPGVPFPQYQHMYGGYPGYHYGYDMYNYPSGTSYGSYDPYSSYGLIYDMITTICCCIYGTASLHSSPIFFEPLSPCLIGYGAYGYQAPQDASTALLGATAEHTETEGRNMLANRLSISVTYACIIVLAGHSLSIPEFNHRAWGLQDHPILLSPRMIFVT